MNQTTTLVIVIVLIVAIIGFRIYRSVREQRWSITKMWIVPIIFVCLLGVIVGIDVPTSIWVVPAAIAGLAAGLGVGLYQGTHTTVRADHAAGNVYIKISPIGNIIFLGVLALRIGLRFIVAPPSAAAGHAGAAGALALSPEATIISGALLALAVGMLIGLRIYVQRIYNAQAAGA